MRRTRLFFIALTAALLGACGDPDGSGSAGNTGGSGGQGGGGQGGDGQGGAAGGAGGAGGSGGGGGQGGAGGSSPAKPVEGESKVVRSCAPNDGPAFTFTIGIAASTCDAMPLVPVLRISIFTNIDSPAGKTWDVAQSSPDGFGVFYPSADPSDLVFTKEGTLKIDTWDATKAATGSYDLVLQDGTHLAGSFNAVACLVEQPMCG